MQQATWMVLKKDTQAPTTEHAPVNTTDAAAPNYVNPNNAATVGDVLNAGWNFTK